MDEILFLGGILVPVLSLYLVMVALLTKKIGSYIITLIVTLALAFSYAVYWFKDWDDGGTLTASYDWHSYWNWLNSLGWVALGLSLVIVLIRKRAKRGKSS